MPNGITIYVSKSLYDIYIWLKNITYQLLATLQKVCTMSELNIRQLKKC